MATYQAYIPKKESEASASDEDRLGRVDLIQALECCKIPHQDWQFYILVPQHGIGGVNNLIIGMTTTVQD